MKTAIRWWMVPVAVAFLVMVFRWVWLKERTMKTGDNDGGNCFAAFVAFIVVPSVVIGIVFYYLVV